MTRRALLKKLRAHQTTIRRLAHGEFYRAYYHAILRAARRTFRLSEWDAEDLTQAFFLHLWKDQPIRAWDAGRGPLWPFLFGILRNLWLRVHRREHPAAEPLGSADVPSPEEDPSLRLARQEMAQRLGRARAATKQFLREEGRADWWELFEKRYPAEGSGTSLRELGWQNGLHHTQVERRIDAVREEFRRRIASELGEGDAGKGLLRALGIR